MTTMSSAFAVSANVIKSVDSPVVVALSVAVPLEGVVVEVSFEIISEVLVGGAGARVDNVRVVAARVDNVRVVLRRDVVEVSVVGMVPNTMPKAMRSPCPTLLRNST
ncbi:unnamed protein product [Prorocentrum cordatum]|uniref:Uncharacterized protein n=1 Tax=Prorocentrum cordatum TaxID=2364126 RepID=A0ABN9V088_9DINO|nr:unnamed protein product [Polarella glacialis]